MEYLKIQMDMLKTYNKKLTWQPWQLRQSKDGFEVTNGIVLVIIPEKWFMLDSSKFMVGNSMMEHFKHEEGTPIVSTKCIKQIDKIKAEIFKTQDGREVYINCDYVKYFDSDCIMYQEKQKSPIFVVRDEQVVGLVMEIVQK